MFKPIGDLIVIEKHVENSNSLIMPDSVAPAKGDIFKVKDVGQGMINDQGVTIPHGIEVGDLVALAGQILRVPVNEAERKEALVARVSDVILVDKEHKFIEMSRA